MSTGASLPHRHPSRLADGVAHPGFIPPCSAPDARPPSVCASDGAPEAHHGRFLPVTGGGIKRLASDAAAFRKGGDQPREKGERNVWIARLVWEGATQKDVAAAFGLSQARVSHICAKYSLRSKREAERSFQRRARLAERADLYVQWYNAGLHLREVGEKFGVSGATVGNILQGHHDYVPRQCSLPGRLWNGLIPPWLPERHHDRYRRIAASNGEEVAAGCLRRLKALEAH